MSVADIMLALLLAALFAAVFGALFDLAPLFAKAMVRRAAAWWHSELDSPEQLAEEWQALIDQRPVGSLKVATGLGFLVKATFRHGVFVAQPIGGRCGRLLRMLVGVDDRVLDVAPGLRRRYTVLGLVVLSSSAVGSISMAYALALAMGSLSTWLLLLSLLWGCFTLCLERWLVDQGSASGPHRVQLFASLVLRIMYAGVFGLIVAEPIILRVFQSEIDRHLRTGAHGQISLVERFSELSALSSSSASVAVYAWGLRVLLALVFALPALVSSMWRAKGWHRAAGS